MYFLLGLHTFIWNIIIIEVKQTWFWLCETWYMKCSRLCHHGYRNNWNTHLQELFEHYTSNKWKCTLSVLYCVFFVLLPDVVKQVSNFEVLVLVIGKVYFRKIDKLKKKISSLKVDSRLSILMKCNVTLDLIKLTIQVRTHYDENYWKWHYDKSFFSNTLFSF